MYKNCKIIMLPTNEKAPKIGMISTRNDNRKLQLVNETLITMYSAHEKFGDFAQAIPYQYLYIVSDEEIKEGDYVIEDIGGTVYGPIDSESIVENPKKIIATTDKSLVNTKKVIGRDDIGNIYNPVFLPQIPQSFVEYYVAEHNKGNIITEVMVE